MTFVVRSEPIVIIREGTNVPRLVGLLLPNRERYMEYTSIDSGVPIVISCSIKYSRKKTVGRGKVSLFIHEAND
jgi:hypothetical protein